MPADIFGWSRLHLPTKRQVLEQMEGIEKKFFQSLREMSDNLGEEIRLAGLGDKEKRIVEEVFDRKNPTCLRGKEAADFIRSIEDYETNRPSLAQIKNILR